MRRIYIAGFFGAKERLSHERNRLQRGGLGLVVSTWLDEALTTTSQAPASTIMTPHECRVIAIRDEEEIASLGPSGLLILDTFEVSERGGREWEAGYAKRGGTEVWQVGPPRNVFHANCPHFDTWDEVRDALIKEEK